MFRRFETFVTAITQINRSIQKIKSQEMARFHLKGTHVMCLFYLQQHPQGLTAAQLAQFCEEDKAAVSRAIAELRTRSLVFVPEDSSHRRYRAIITLTDEGKEITLQMNKRIVDAVENAAKGYSDEERAVFYRVLLQVADNLQNTCLQKEGIEG